MAVIWTDLLSFRQYSTEIPKKRVIWRQLASAYVTACALYVNRLYVNRLYAKFKREINSQIIYSRDYKQAL